MPVLLALDSSTEACSVAVCYQNEIIKRYKVAPREHSQLLLPMVDEVLSEAEISLSQVDGIAFGCGPGGFTGLRICAGTVQGLAFGADLPVFPVSSLESMAQRAMREFSLQQDQYVLPAIDARMGEVYWGLYKVDNQLVVSQRDQAVMSPENVADIVTELEFLDELQGVGTGWGLDVMKVLPVNVSKVDFFPTASDLLPRAKANFELQLGVSAAEVEPVYLRNEVSWQKRKRLRNP